MIEPAKILIIELREFHVMRQYVAVCWSLVEQVKTLTGKDGQVYTAKVHRRAFEVEDKIWNQPYIVFVDIRYEEDSIPYLNEDSPVDGGVTVKFAAEIRDELTLAIDYWHQIMAKLVC